MHARPELNYYIKLHHSSYHHSQRVQRFGALFQPAVALSYVSAGLTAMTASECLFLPPTIFYALAISQHLYDCTKFFLIMLYDD